MSRLMLICSLFAFSCGVTAEPAAEEEGVPLPAEVGKKVDGLYGSCSMLYECWKYTGKMFYQPCGGFFSGICVDACGGARCPTK